MPTWPPTSWASRWPSSPPTPYATCLDLGSYGAVLTTGWDRKITQTGAEAKQLERSINAEWIYPLVDDAETILRHADHHITWPIAAVSQRRATSAVCSAAEQQHE